jgi:CRISPR type I-E-associated protein CasA/Cse1
MNLITSPWCPIRGEEGDVRWLSLADLLHEDAPATSALSDPLLDEVLIEVLGALLWLLARPQDERAWQAVWESNGADIDRRRLQVLAPYFDLFTGARAFQDPTVGSLPEQPIAGLLHASPGDQTLKHNKDIGPDGPRGLAPGAAAVALYAMQAHAKCRGRGVSDLGCGWRPAPHRAAHGRHARPPGLGHGAAARPA